MKTCFRALFIFLTGWSITLCASAQSPQFYLLLGQSNMAGRAPITEQEEKPIAHCLLFNDKGQWEPATNPFNRYSTVRKGTKNQGLNPGYGFALTMLKNQPQETTLGIVSNARAGTSIQLWAKGGRLYTQAVNRALEAKKAGGVLKGVLWHQGENNSPASEGYSEKLVQLVTDLRQDLGDADLPFVFGQIKKDGTLNAEIDKATKQLKHVAVASSKDLTANGAHFDTPGMIELGKRFAEAMIQLQVK